jgi:monofunctional biosynthetic peptidoglycan transglycosylase
MVKKVFGFIKKATLWFFALSIFVVILYRFVPVPFTPLMAARFVENTFAGNEVYFDHDWESIENISPNLQKAVIASEDATFQKHHGFDFNAIEKALRSNKKGKRLRGGSTISQQTAKNVFLWQGRSWIRKGLEAYFTVLIEVFWSKQRIMEVYLNSIEMGDGVYGAQAASRHWYSKDAYQLSKREAAGIAAILPNPRKFEASHSSSFINRRKDKIMTHMRYVKLDY